MNLSRVILILLLLPTAARASNFKDFRDRCQFTLTTLKSKGIAKAMTAWDLFPMRGLPNAADQMTSRQSEDIFLDRVADHVGRELTDHTVGAAILELATDHARPLAVVRDALRLARVTPLPPEVLVQIVDALHEHPNVTEPSAVLAVTLNPAYPDRDIPRVLHRAVNAETRVDQPGTAYSARPASILVQLRRERRIDDWTLVNVFRRIFENPRADLDGLFKSLVAFRSHVENLYVYGEPLPPQRLTLPLLEQLERRLRAMPGELRAEMRVNIRRLKLML